MVCGGVSLCERTSRACASRAMQQRSWCSKYNNRVEHHRVSGPATGRAHRLPGTAWLPAWRGLHSASMVSNRLFVSNSGPRIWRNRHDWGRRQRCLQLPSGRPEPALGDHTLVATASVAVQSHAGSAVEGPEFETAGGSTPHFLPNGVPASSPAQSLTPPTRTDHRGDPGFRKV